MVSVDVKRHVYLPRHHHSVCPSPGEKLNAFRHRNFLLEILPVVECHFYPTPTTPHPFPFLPTCPKPQQQHSLLPSFLERSPLFSLQCQNPIHLLFDKQARWKATVTAKYVRSFCRGKRRPVRPLELLVDPGPRVLLECGLCCRPLGLRHTWPFLTLSGFLFFLVLHCPLLGKFGSPYLGTAQQPQEQRYPYLSVCAVFSCVQTVAWLPLFGIFN